jgi:cytochrome o ubiquinol oxidase operon protein cyoD
MNGISRRGLVAYIIGFTLSLLLTIGAFTLIMNHTLSGDNAIVAIVSLAVVQLFVQLFFFLHLGREKSPYMNLSVLLLATGTIGIIIGGSLWIMRNLDYNMMMTPEETQIYMHNHEGL